MRLATSIALAAALASATPQPAAARGAALCELVPPLDLVLSCERTGAPAAPSGRADASSEAVEPLVAAVPEQPPSHRGLVMPSRDPTRLLVRFERRTTQAEARRVARDAGGVLERRIAAIGLDVVRAEPDRLDAVRAALERSTLVRSVADEQLVGITAVEPNDAHWTEQRGLRVTRFADAWVAARGTPDTVVAVVDTGVSAHPDLEGAVLPGYDLVGNDADASDDHGHGTAVAGVIAARTNNHVGIAGVCWHCRILPVKVLGANGFGSSGAVAAGIVWAADHDADVINLSLGSPSGTEALTRAVAYAARRGAIVVAAAGNAGVASPFYPAAEAGVISVAATDDGDRRYSWSNYGGWVQLAAPGCLPTTTLGGGYGVECGTSFSAPLVAGLAGLALGASPGLAAGGVADAIARGAVPIGAIVRAGRVDAARTLSLLPRAENRRSVVVRGTLTRARPAQTVSVVAGAGVLEVAVTSPGRRVLAVTVVGAGGRTIARARGRSPVRLAPKVEPGRYRVKVYGPGGRFRASVAYSGPPA